MNDVVSDRAVLVALATYSKNLGEADSAQAAFRYAEQTTRELIGHRLFTIMRFDAQTMLVSRLYSSNDTQYPAGGQKLKKETAWGRQVLEQGRVFIGRHPEDIREHFSDHAVIESLGLGSVLNFPIRNLGATVGTMNLLDRADSYRPEHVSIAGIIAGGLAGVLLSIAN